jgi:hypothetical protein
MPACHVSSLIFACLHISPEAPKELQVISKTQQSIQTMSKSPVVIPYSSVLIAFVFLFGHAISDAHWPIGSGGLGAESGISATGRCYGVVARLLAEDKRLSSFGNPVGQVDQWQWKHHFVSYTLGHRLKFTALFGPETSD